MSLTTMRVRPAEGLIVRDPETGVPLPAKGRDVPRTPYWLRRLRDGDVIDPAAEKAAAEEAKPAKRGQ